MAIPVNNFDEICSKLEAMVAKDQKVEVKRATTQLLIPQFVRKVIREKHHVILINTKDRNGKGAFISFEKSDYGVLVQFSRLQENVYYLCDGKWRRKRWKEKETLMRATTLEDVLREIRASADEGIERYCLCGNNCIDFADIFERIIKDCNDKVEFMLPGKSKGMEKVTLNDRDRILEHFQEQYPDWQGLEGENREAGKVGEKERKGKVSYIPKYAHLKLSQNIEGNTAQPVAPSLGSDCQASPNDQTHSESKAKRNEHILECLINCHRDKNISCLVLPLLNRGFIERPMEEDPKCNIKWNNMLENLVLSVEYGLIWIVEADQLFDENLQQRLIKGMQLLLLVHKIVGLSEKKLPITIIACKEEFDYYKFNINKQKLEKSSSKGSLFWVITNGDCMSQAICKVLSKIHTKVPPILIEKLAGTLMLLHCLEDNFLKTHEQRINQSANHSYITFTADQIQVIDYARYKFQNQQTTEFLRLFIKGCPGSGKTLILLQLAIDYINVNPSKKVCISIFKRFSELKQFLQERVKVLGCCGKICHKCPTLDTKLLIQSPNEAEEIQWNDFGLVLIDEYEAFHHTMEDGKFLGQICKQEIDVVVSTSIGSINVRTLNGIITRGGKEADDVCLFEQEGHPLKNIDLDHDEVDHGINFSVNLRSPPAVVSFCHEYQTAVLELVEILKKEENEEIMAKLCVTLQPIEKGNNNGKNKINRKDFTAYTTADSPAIAEANDGTADSPVNIAVHAATNAKHKIEGKRECYRENLSVDAAANTAAEATGITKVNAAAPALANVTANSTADSPTNGTANTQANVAVHAATNTKGKKNPYQKNVYLDGDIIPCRKPKSELPENNSLYLEKWEDSSRQEFIAGASEAIILEIQRKNASGMICNLSHLSIRREIKERVKKRVSFEDHWEFIDVRQSLGSQYPVVVIILDYASAAFNLARLTEAATRATVRLVVLWNMTNEPYFGK